MFTKVLIAALAVVLCTGGVALAAAVTDTIPTVSSDSEQSLLEATAAEDVALEAAGLTREQVRFDRSELDYEHGKQVWEVEFQYENTEYDFEIDAYTGEILKSRSEIDDDYARPPVGEVTPPPANEVTSPPATEPTVGEPAAELTEDQALELALNHADLTPEQASRIKVEKDFDDGRWVYEIEFQADGYEYEYEIRASDGKIVDYDKDWDD